jgi:hypothetical protein
MTPLSILPILLLLVGCATDPDLSGFTSYLAAATDRYEQSQERMAAEIRAAALPPFPEDAPQPKLGWDQEDIDIVSGWNVYTNGVLYRSTVWPVVDIPDAEGVVKLTATAFNSIGVESEHSEPFYITNTPPLKNVVITYVFSVTLTNPTGSLFYALCTNSTLNPGGWRPALSQKQIHSHHE